MNWIRDKVMSGKVISGTFLNLGSNVIAEMAGNAGFDYVLIDMEHGAGDQDALVPILQGVSATRAAPIVRIAWNEPPRFKRVLDMGAAGVMVPLVNSAEDARQAVRAMRYPPAGIRGAAGSNRAANFGKGFMQYFKEANEKLLCIVQIETVDGLDQVDEIASVDGVDVLYIGPNDLSISMGIIRQFDHPRMQEAYKNVIAACRRHEKQAGILISQPEQIGGIVDQGFTFITLSSDGTNLANIFHQQAAAFEPYRA